MNYDAKTQWNEVFLKTSMIFPSEYVIRIFKGSYPRLNLDKSQFHGKKICDIGHGDGRNLVVLHQAGFDLHGVEISSEIVTKVKNNLSEVGIKANLKVGGNDRIDFADQYFDYMLSWNSCYYMGGPEKDFSEYLQEFQRVLKQDGTFVVSIPKKSCFIYKGCEEIRPGYAKIMQDPFQVRNGEILRIFQGEQDIEETFSPYFKDFIFGSIEDDCFGFDYHWHLMVCKKR